MQKEKYGFRDGAYSAWHRVKSTRRFVGLENAQLLAMIDLDVSLYVEYDHDTKEPVALIEVAVDVGQEHKTTTVMKNLSIRADLPCYVVLYTLSGDPNPANPEWNDIISFRVRRLYPRPEYSWRTLTPSEWAHGLLKLRRWSTKRLDEI